MLPGRIWLLWYLKEADTRIVMLILDATDKANIKTEGKSGLLYLMESTLFLKLKFRLLDTTSGLMPIIGKLHH